MIYLAAFFAQTIVELLFVRSLYAVSARKPFLAAIQSALAFWIQGLAIVCSARYDIWLLVPLTLGVFAGVALAVTWERYREQPETIQVEADRHEALDGSFSHLLGSGRARGHASVGRVKF